MICELPLAVNQPMTHQENQHIFIIAGKGHNTLTPRFWLVRYNPEKGRIDNIKGTVELITHDRNPPAKLAQSNWGADLHAALQNNLNIYRHVKIEQKRFILFSTDYKPLLIKMLTLSGSNNIETAIDGFFQFTSSAKRTQELHRLLMMTSTNRCFIDQ
ncbi:hypothetical protein C9J03_25280 [Photobacterium gaetbulicola]|nr:hypothetical protein [Photobacterium gaetbulicola]PSU00002.1 hypothetical protein C9J03_25280 [Photobacterium gaetbulicola]